MASNDGMSKAWQEETVGQMLAGLVEQRRQLTRLGPGKSVALMVIDMQHFFLPDGDPVIEAALAAIRRLLDRARALSVPVILIRNVFDRVEDISPFWLAKRNGRPFIMRDDPSSELHAGLGRLDTDIVVDKPHASAFFGSALDDQLSACGIDTVMLTGAFTSACVRATAVDGAARHYRVMVVEECTYDKNPLSASVALFDIANGYGDVIAFDEAVGILDRQGAGAAKASDAPRLSSAAAE